MSFAVPSALPAVPGRYALPLLCQVKRTRRGTTHRVNAVTSPMSAFISKANQATVYRAPLPPPHHYVICITHAGK